MTHPDDDPRLTGIVQMVETALKTLEGEFPQKREAARHLNAAIDSLKSGGEGTRPENLSSANDD